MKKQIKQKYLEELDDLLVPLGFKRTKQGQEWKRKFDKSNQEWIHLNFGLGTINPSFGVEFLDLGKMIPKEFGAVTGIMEMLSPISGEQYFDETDPKVLAEHISNFVISAFPKLRSREAVIGRLKVERPHEWPVSCRSDRIRLLPLLLASISQNDKALEYIEYFLKDYDDYDQILPKYEVFAEYFKKNYHA